MIASMNRLIVFIGTWLEENPAHELCKYKGRMTTVRKYAVAKVWGQQIAVVDSVRLIVNTGGCSHVWTEFQVNTIFD